MPTQSATDVIALIGIDENGNGIRDDVDDFLKKQKVSKSTLTAAENYAITLQTRIATRFSDKAQYRDFYMKNVVPSIKRMVAFDGGYTLLRGVERATLNTSARLKKISDDNALMNGEMISLGE